MNHQAKVVSNDSIVVYFSLYEVSQSTGVPVKELMRAIGNIVGPLSGLAYVSVINRTDAKKWDREENFFPLLNEAKFTVNTSLLKLDISGTIISCKITLLNPNTPHDHLMSYQTGLVKGEYNFVPRLVSNGKYLYPKPQDQIDPEAEGEVIPNGSVSIIGFDLLFNDTSRVEEPTPSGIKERFDEIFPGMREDVDIDHFQRHAPPYSVQPLYPVEVPDPHFTPTAIGVNKIQENQSDRRKLVIDLDNVEDLEKLKGLFRGFNYPQMYDEKNINTLASIFSAHFKESEDSAFADLEKVVEFFLPVNLPADIRSKVIELIAAKWAGFKHA